MNQITLDVKLYAESTDDDILYLKHDVEVLKEIGNNDHISNIGELHHKTIKYINDLLYIEEGNVYGSHEWHDRATGGN